MVRTLALSFIAVVVIAASAAAQAQAPAKAPGSYDPGTEVTYGGVINSVIAVTGKDGAVGVHVSLKTGTGVIVNVQLGPALFIGMNDFYFVTDEQILVKGAYVVHDGEVALWARQVSKKGKTLNLRGDDGTPRWPFATAEDPDGCGVSHAPVRYRER